MSYSNTCKYEDVIERLSHLSEDELRTYCYNENNINTVKIVLEYKKRKPIIKNK